MMKFIDLSHVIEHGMTTYKGLPAPLICDFMSREASRKNYDQGAEFYIGKTEMVANTGTYLDCSAKNKAFGTFPVRAFAQVEVHPDSLPSRE